MRNHSNFLPRPLFFHFSFGRMVCGAPAGRVGTAPGQRMTSMTLLAAQNVCKEYRGEGAPVEVLRGIDFHLNEGERVGVFGASGAGKSTLLHLLGGIDVPTRG